MTSTAAVESATPEATHGQLESRYRANLALFEERIPVLHKGLSAHVPRALRIAVGESGAVDLVGVDGGASVYGGDARTHARSQVAEFVARPQHGRVRTLTSTVIDEADNAHMSNANEAVRALLAIPPDDVDELPPVVDYMLMLGLGLGYHIESLLEISDVRHLCLVESNVDIVHASLYTMDWRALLDHFGSAGRSLELVLGPDVDAAARSIAAHLDRLGHFNAVRPFVYEHASAPTLAAVKARFFDDVIPSGTNHLGYFDDERVGFAHTLRNYDAGVPVLQDHVLLNRTHVDAPAFLVANGPSLDRSIDFLRAHRERAIVFSCGTALGSLRKAGIKPDFHVEMERSRPVVEWIEGATTGEDRKDVTLLALNTVHPEVFRLFGRSGMALKANDAGTTFLTRYASAGSSIINFGNCNPTVANSALAYAAAFGFRDVYLFGLDLGFPSAGQHHSSLSLHYDIDEGEHADLGVYRHDSERNLVGRGNLGGEIVTTRVYASAARSAERLIAATPGLRCYNVGEGLRITGARPCTIEGLSIEVVTPDGEDMVRGSTIPGAAGRDGSAPGWTETERTGTGGRALDRRAVVDALYRRYFSRAGLRSTRPGDGAKVLARTGGLVKTLATIAETPVRSRSDGMAVLERLRREVETAAADESLRYSAALLKGSVSFFSLVLAQALHRFADAERSVALYEECRDRFDDFLAGAGAQLGADPLAADTRSRNLARRLESAGRG